jgi:pentapeptide MXKDX repeat protein
MKHSNWTFCIIMAFATAGAACGKDKTKPSAMTDDKGMTGGKMTGDKMTGDKMTGDKMTGD